MYVNSYPVDGVGVAKTLESLGLCAGSSELNYGISIKLSFASLYV